MNPDTPDINAGAWYLRARGTGAWEVCEPTTGEVRAVVSVTGEPAAAAAGAEAVGRFLLLQLVTHPGEAPGQSSTISTKASADRRSTGPPSDSR